MSNASIDFLHQVFRGCENADKERELLFLLWTLPGKDSYWFKVSNIDNASRLIETLTAQEQNVYLEAALSAKDYGRKKRCPADDTFGVTSLWLDIDILSPLHKKPNLPSSVEEATWIIDQMGLPPTVVVHSGHGLQAWWMFDSPCLFRSAEDRVQAQELAKKWNSLAQAIAGTRDWTVDSVHDFARVMRLPGTVNFKDPKNSKPCEVLRADYGRRYSPSELQKALDSAGGRFFASNSSTNGHHLRQSRTLNQVSATVASASGQGSGAGPEAASGQGSGAGPEAASGQSANRIQGVVSPGMVGGGLVLRMDAQPPEAKFQALMEFQEKFKETWENNRVDFRKDRSPNAYDQALANFAALVEDPVWTDQEIADLLIAFRREHNIAAKIDSHGNLRIDYYARTIRKARECGGYQRRQERFERVIEESRSQESVGTVEESRDKVFKSISARIFVKDPKWVIEHVVRHHGDDDAIYFIIISGERIKLGSVENLTSHSRFKNKVAGVTGTLIEKMKSEDWDWVAWMLLKYQEKQETGDMSTDIGLMRILLDRFLGSISRELFEKTDEATGIDQRRPYRNGDEIWICGQQFFEFCCRDSPLKKLSSANFSSMLRSAGAIPERRVLTIGQRRTSRHMWHIHWKNIGEEWCPMTSVDGDDEKGTGAADVLVEREPGQEG